MITERKFKPGDMVECWPDRRDSIRRVGIVEEGIDENGFFTVWMLDANPQTGKMMSVWHGTFQMPTNDVRLLVPADSIGAGGGPMASTVDEIADEIDKLIVEAKASPSCPRCGSTDPAKRFNDDCRHDWHEVAYRVAPSAEDEEWAREHFGPCA